ncbi:trypsin-like serine protease [Paraglaciecola aquimarina]|uniref:Trypsin-like serine protease n=1 Tax=Paraglaciecola algarum TaxID=3050085 RepID=A0ABS9D6H6_9ALTE|nr:trypsin-like serine protease [Paraglaciecola sp. G1-23]MCF2947648.1 trypsin-like serine protease [Paraglaciecola sp. G1-23]
MNTKGDISPAIIAGNEFDDSGAPLVPAGAFTGVVSIQINTNEGLFICTGSAISKRHIITAAHCVEDSTTTGKVIDINDPNFNVTTVFTDGGFLNAVRGSQAVDIHPDYQGFAQCGIDDVSGFFGACLNDDIAVITLDDDIPNGVEIYDFYRGDMPINNGTLLTMVGHGTTGNGYDGATPNSADFFNKRFGFNLTEFFDCDDGTSTVASGGYSNSIACELFHGNEAEVWYADFDGYDAFLAGLGIPGQDGFIDTFCSDYNVGCGNGLGDNFSGLFEAAIGGGDSGGPSFIYDALSSTFVLAANNTFGTSGRGPFGVDGAFGEIFGGNLYAPYLEWIDNNYLNVSAPTSVGLLLLSIFFIAAQRRLVKY